jgi:hypothetical protein
MFKRNSKYYILYGKDCGFCPEGSNIYVKISNHPLGLYKDNKPLDIRADKLINAQSSFVATINTIEGKQYIYIGDRWRSAPGIAYYKGHDYQYWSEPLQFDRKGNVKPIKWNNEWTVNLK